MFYFRMEQFLLGAPDRSDEEEKSVRISAPEIVSEMRESMEKGTKKHCYKNGNPAACIALSDYYRETSNNIPLAAKVMVDCCDRLQNPVCCWESSKYI